MTESTRAVAQLPGLDVELVHDKSDDGSAERVAIRFTGRPDLKTAAKAVEPHLLSVLMAANPMISANPFLGANPLLTSNPFFRMQMDMARKIWGPLLEMNPLLKGMLPPPDEPKK